jgi:hypothetical protein
MHKAIKRNAFELLETWNQKDRAALKLRFLDKWGCKRFQKHNLDSRTYLQQDTHRTKTKVFGEEFGLQLSKRLSRKVLKHGNSSDKGGVNDCPKPCRVGQEVNCRRGLGRNFS